MAGLLKIYDEHGEITTRLIDGSPDLPSNTWYAATSVLWAKQ